MTPAKPTNPAKPAARPAGNSPAARLARLRPRVPPAWRERFDTFWNARNPREQAILGGGTVVLVLVFGYLVLWEPAATGRAWRPRMHTGHEGAQTRPPTGTAAGVGRTEERHRSRNSPRWGLSARPAARQATRLSRLALCPAASVRPVSKAHRT